MLRKFKCVELRFSGTLATSQARYVMLSRRFVAMMMIVIINNIINITKQTKLAGCYPVERERTFHVLTVPQLLKFDQDLQPHHVKPLN